MLDPLIDAAGNRHHRADTDARIVSLVPSITELLFDLGLGGHVVGRTAFCVHPKGDVRRAVSVGGTKQVVMEKLLALAPSHVIVNIDETPRELADDLARRGMTVVVTHPIDPTDNLDLYRLIGGLFGRRSAAEALCQRFESAFAALTAAADGRPPRPVLYLIWKDPWMTISRDTYISRMLSLINWQIVGHDPNVRYPPFVMTEESLSLADLVLFSTEPFPFNAKHVEAFRTEYPGHADKARLIEADLVSWYGSRAVAGLEYLAKLASD